MTNNASFEPASDIARDWTDAFAQRTAEGFAEAFAENVVLEATILVNPVQGRDNVKQVMAAASKIYKSLEFTKAVSAQRGRQFYRSPLWHYCAALRKAACRVASR